MNVRQVNDVKRRDSVICCLRKRALVRPHWRRPPIPLDGALTRHTLICRFVAKTPTFWLEDRRNLSKVRVTGRTIDSPTRINNMVAVSANLCWVPGSFYSAPDLKTSLTSLASWLGTRRSWIIGQRQLLWLNNIFSRLSSPLGITLRRYDS